MKKNVCFFSLHFLYIGRITQSRFVFCTCENEVKEKLFLQVIYFQSIYLYSCFSRNQINGTFRGVILSQLFLIRTIFFFQIITRSKNTLPVRATSGCYLKSISKEKIILVHPFHAVATIALVYKNHQVFPFNHFLGFVFHYCSIPLLICT